MGIANLLPPPVSLSHSHFVQKGELVQAKPATPFSSLFCGMFTRLFIVVFHFQPYVIPLFFLMLVTIVVIASSFFDSRSYHSSHALIPLIFCFSVAHGTGVSVVPFCVFEAIGLSQNQNHLILLASACKLKHLNFACP